MATAKKSADQAQQTEAAVEVVTLIVACPSGKRFRAGLEFGAQPRTVTVSAEQAEQIKGDPLLSVSAA